jgi:hypothetical protein
MLTDEAQCAAARARHVFTPLSQPLPLTLQMDMVQWRCYGTSYNMEMTHVDITDLNEYSLTGLTDRDTIVKRLQEISILAVEHTVNQRDFGYEGPIGRIIAAFRAPRFCCTFQNGPTVSDEEFLKLCKAKAEAFPAYRIECLDPITDLDMKTGTATVFLRTLATEQEGIRQESCTTFEWRLFDAGKTARWLIARQTIMRGFAAIDNMTDTPMSIRTDDSSDTEQSASPLTPNKLAG